MLQTVLHAYHFNVARLTEREAYDTLRAKLTAAGLNCFESHGGDSHYRKDLDGQTLILETTHLFDNQWNTAPIPGISDLGIRVFDWAQDSEYATRNRDTKRGYYLEQTPAMRTVREHRFACGFCGYQTDETKVTQFCDRCLDSEYLKESELYLLRMLPVMRGNFARPPLSELELAALKPLFVDAQTHGSTARGRERLTKARERVAAEYATSVANAQAKHDGLMWLMARGINTDNVIYYDHTGKFSFGWRKPLSGDEYNALQLALHNGGDSFPFDHDIKTTGNV